MRRLYSICLITVTIMMLTFASASTARSEVYVDLNMNIGFPEFVLPPSLGFYVAVDVPYDLYRVNNSYFIFMNNRWYKGRYYNGPWIETHYSYLPPPLRRYKHRDIRIIRDREYHHYRTNPHDYRRHKDRYYRPTKRWEDDRRDHRNYRDHRDRRDYRDHRNPPPPPQRMHPKPKHDPIHMPIDNRNFNRPYPDRRQFHDNRDNR